MNIFQPQHWEKTKTFTDADNFLPLSWNQAKPNFAKPAEPITEKQKREIKMVFQGTFPSSLLFLPSWNPAAHLLLINDAVCLLMPCQKISMETGVATWLKIRMKIRLQGNHEVITTTKDYRIFGALLMNESVFIHNPSQWCHSVDVDLHWLTVLCLRETLQKDPKHKASEKMVKVACCYFITKSE